MQRRFPLLGRIWEAESAKYRPSDRLGTVPIAPRFPGDGSELTLPVVGPMLPLLWVRSRPGEYSGSPGLLLSATLTTSVPLSGLAWLHLASYPALMPEVTEKQIEIEARRNLREKIKRMPSHQGCSPEERRRRIEADVDRWWHLEVEEATRRLLDKLG